VALSNFVKKTVVEETFVQEDKITVIHNGVDESKFNGIERKKKGSGEEVRIIFIGRVIRAKGLFVLIDSLCRLNNLNWKLDIIGEGESLGSLKNEVSRKGLSDKVNFSGFIAYENIIKKLSQSDIFVLTSMRMEVFP
jgi:glycosyltransferase involved in cell wall biosynthesis